MIKIKSIFNKNAFKIKTKTDHAVKFLDGGWEVELIVDVWESGDKVTKHFTIMRDCIGHIQIDQGIGL